MRNARRNVLNAPFCWMGGKSRLQKLIVNKIPDHTCYVEVFGGAGWILFGKAPSKVEVYNDIDGDLVNFFRVVKNCRRAFLQAFDLILVSRKLFTDFINTDPADLDEIQRAVRFFYIVKTSFAGKWEGANYGYAKGTNSGLNLESLNEHIEGVYRRLRRVNVEEASFGEAIARYDGPDTFFYLDPPYFETGGYRFNIDLEDHRRLAAILEKIQGKFLLSINDHPAMREVYGKFDIGEIEVPYSISRDKGACVKYGELLLKNYEEGLGLFI